MTSLAAVRALAPRGGPWVPIVLIAVLAGVLTVHQLGARLPPGQWWSALVAPDPDDIQQLLVHYGVMPRVAVAWICGGALALASVAVQQVLRNPLAEPMTLGIFPGAYLALLVAAVFAPSWLSFGRDAVGLAGAAAALALVFVLASRRGFSPLALILGGMIVNLYCGALGFALTVTHYDLLVGLMIWGGGAFGQHDWSVVSALLLRLSPCAVLLLLCLRPMVVIDAGDEVAASLGVSLRATRVAVLGLTLLVTAFVVSAVGVIGFIGLAAPSLARLAGARRLRDRLLWAPALGAALLWLADQAAQQFSGPNGGFVPTGAVTSLLGAPLLLVLLPRLRGQPLPVSETSVPAEPAPGNRFRFAACVCMVVLLAVIGLSLGVGRGLDGWRLNSIAEISSLLFLRLPHVIAAMGVGVLLALAGGMIQRMTGNPMASPDLLGITAGGALGMTAALFLMADPGMADFLLWCAGGSAATLAVLLFIGRRSSYSPDSLVLAGITISAIFQGIVTIAIASHDSRTLVLYSLLVGSTYNVSAAASALVAVLALVSLAAAPYCTRWLEILPLGDSVARELGVNIVAARFVLLLFSALLTAAATLVIGPLSFVGLMAPHMARMLGVRRAWQQLLLAAAIGATLMVGADWLGRFVLFPREMPTGVMATLIGGLYLIVMMFVRSHAPRAR